MDLTLRDFSARNENSRLNGTKAAKAALRKVFDIFATVIAWRDNYTSYFECERINLFEDVGTVCMCVQCVARQFEHFLLGAAGIPTDVQ